MLRVQLHVIGGRKRWIEVPDDITGQELHELVWRELENWNLKLVMKGKCLEKGAKHVDVKYGDTIVVMPPRFAPPEHISRLSDPDPSQEDEELKFRLPPEASPLQKSIAHILQHRLHLPDLMLIWLFSVKPRVWVILALWILCSPIAARWDLGPIYILGTVFALMIFHLGKRKPGETSAYSWFNNYQALPGQLNADVIDNQLRRGQM